MGSCTREDSGSHKCQATKAVIYRLQSLNMKTNIINDKELRLRSAPMHEWMQQCDLPLILQGASLMFSKYAPIYANIEESLRITNFVTQILLTMCSLRCARNEISEQSPHKIYPTFALKYKRSIDAANYPAHN